MHCITIYPARRNLTDIGILVLTFILIIVLLALSVPVIELRANASTAVKLTILALCIIASLLPLPAYYFFVLWVGRRRMRRRQPIRSRRLAAIAQHPDAWPRLPHRMVEWELLGSREPMGRIKKLIRRIPAGDAIAIRHPRDPAISRPSPTDHPFEPIDIENDDEQLAWLDALGDERQRKLIETGDVDPATARMFVDYYDTHHSDSDSQDHPRASEKVSLGEWFRFGKTLLFRAAITIFLIVQLFRLVRTLLLNPTPSSLILFGILVLFFFAAGIKALFRRQSVFLIPGGIALRVTRYAGYRASIYRLTPANTALVMYAGKVFCGTEDEQRFVFDLPHGEYTLLTAWLSRARTPDQRQLDMMLDPNGRDSE